MGAEVILTGVWPKLGHLLVIACNYSFQPTRVLSQICVTAECVAKLTIRKEEGREVIRPLKSSWHYARSGQDKLLLNQGGLPAFIDILTVGAWRGAVFVKNNPTTPPHPQDLNTNYQPPTP